LFPIIHVDAPEDSTEPSGSRPKFWFVDQNSVRYLFTYSRPGTGEHWSEKIACELCRLLDLPHAEYDLAIYKGAKGIVSKSFVPEDGRLVHGNELLPKVIRDYDQKQIFRQRQYTLRAVIAILSSMQIKPPLGWPKREVLVSAMDIFVGYLMLDCWIANQDRHHENWGLVLNKEGIYHLAPTYDHASSLGRNETDQARQDRLTTRDSRRSIETYVAKARTAFYETPVSERTLFTIDAFQMAAKKHPAAKEFWLKQLSGISSDLIERLFEKVPNTEISETGSLFARKMLYLNQERLLSLIKD